MYIFITISCVLLFSFTSFCAPKDNGQIEEFIDKLLTSDKFDKLADKIAEKAADKLIVLQHANEEKKSDVNRANANMPPPKRIYSDEEKQEIRKVTKKNIDRPVEKKFSSNEDTNVKLLIDKDKMNTAATIPAGELSLNYKHFTTQETSRPDSAKYTAVSFKKKYDSNENSVEYPNKKRDHLNTYKYKHENDEMHKRVQSSSENSGNSTETTSKPAKTESDISADNDSLQESKTNSDESDVSSTEEGSTSKFEVTTPKATTTKEKHTHKKTHKKKKNHNKSKSKEAAIESPKVKTTNTSDESDDEKVPIADSANKKEEKKIDYRHMVREENGKLYKFEQSPDYEEYHEQLSQLIESVRDRNKRRFNIKLDI